MAVKVKEGIMVILVKRAIQEQKVNVVIEGIADTPVNKVILV